MNYVGVLFGSLVLGFSPLGGHEFAHTKQLFDLSVNGTSYCGNNDFEKIKKKMDRWRGRRRLALPEED